ncbi:helix-turn-helix transcriptional regulator [Flavobacterium sp. CFBP9031]|uniref:helix-turn-helix transcriptional regulator n=1 Tax=Flavobacterium sp. CFBP9031 TaxID=3096538 RepID=UPI002A69EF1F|nr:helix-turn-helix transcriptional regulator [Flavobacterium sp. CFBP9031]MDY0988866.1 helix-turn-helix transcriptional regulator [Flavobacterium sp. CFBP9031]
MNIIIGNKLKKLRQAKNMSQEEIADYLNISQSAYARMERGVSTSWATHFNKICNLFEIKPENLLSKNEEEFLNEEKESDSIEIVNQLSEKIIEQYEARIKELKKTIKDLRRNRE